MSKRSFYGRPRSAKPTENSGTGIRLFKPDVSYVFVRAGIDLVGRILPGRDLNLLPEDESYLTSVSPYRIADEIDEQTQNPVFNPAWIQWIEAYRFFGKGGHDLISPATLRQIEGVSQADTEDPIEQCRRMAWNDEKLKHLTTSHKVEGKKFDECTLPRSGSAALLNVFGKYDKKPTPHTFITVVGYTAMMTLLEQLDWPRKPKAAILDPDWPDFAYGDVTHPVRGLQFTARQIKDLKKSDLNILCFNADPGTLASMSAVGVKQVPVSEEILRSRHDTLSSDVLNILSYQELVDILVENSGDGEFDIPIKLIHDACGHAANIQGTGEFRPPVGGSGASEDKSSKAADDPFDAPAPNGNTHEQAEDDQLPGINLRSKYWAFIGDGDVEEMTSDAIQEAVNKGSEVTVNFAADGEEADWKLAVDGGFHQPPPAKPEKPAKPAAGATAPAKPSKPSKPTETSKPSKPTETSKPSSPSTDGDKAKAESQSSVESGLTPEEEEEFLQLQTKAREGEDMGDDVLLRLGELVKKRNKK